MPCSNGGLSSIVSHGSKSLRLLVDKSAHAFAEVSVDGDQSLHFSLIIIISRALN